jgi:hypothetical protein
MDEHAIRSIVSSWKAMRRMSCTTLDRLPTLPSWTITRYEVDREENIAVGFFSDIYGYQGVSAKYA